MESDPKERKPQNLDELLDLVGKRPDEVPELRSNMENNVLRAIHLEQARRAEGLAPAHVLEDAWWDLTHQKALVGYGLVLSAALSLVMAQPLEGKAAEETAQGLREASFLLSELDPWERLLRSTHGPQLVD
jgi:hypothetical protein